MGKLFSRYFCSTLLFLFASLAGWAQNYTPLFTSSTFNRSIDVNLAVGATAGEAGVSPTGGSSYAIPIMTPPGTDGVVPSVSLVYNSQGGNGLLGMGWSIGGLSVISRVGQSIYQGGQVSAVELNSDDRFALDGVRLVAKSGSYGASGTTYATESESFAQITSYNTSGVSGTGWFRVIAKDGTVMDYGTTADARLSNGTGNAPVLAWYLIKIKYPNGNYIAFIYDDQSNPRIDQIIYTGNIGAGLAPYNKIQFTYTDRTDVNTVNEAGLFISDSKLLEYVTVTADNQPVRTYQLKYGFDNINSYLNEVIEKGSDGSQLNSTIFKYGDLPLPNGEFTRSLNGALVNTSNDISPGDFNADGFTDILLKKNYYSNNQEYITGFKIFKRSASDTTLTESFDKTFPTSETYQVVQKTKVPNFYNFLSSDFTGDGADDVVTARVVVNGNDDVTFNSLKIYKSNGTATAFTEDIIPSYPNYTKVPPGGKYVFPGDFDGDGIQDILTILGYGNSYGSHIYYGNSPAPLKFKTLGFAATTYNFGFNDWATAQQIFVLDFNGDGRSDTMVIKGYLCEIYTIDPGASTLRRIYNDGFPNQNHLIYLGDFNGDRKTDLLVRSSNGSWAKATSTGAWFTTASFTFQHTPIINGNYSDDHLTIADYNGDGKTDIYHAWKDFQGSIATTSKLDLYYSRGNSFHYKQYPFPALIGLVGALPFDLNGDGRADLINRTSYDSPFDVFSFRKNGKENLLEKVANGLNHVTEFSYKRLNEDANFYYQGSLGNFYWSNIKVPMPAVYEMKAQNGIGGVSTMQYSYEQARLSKRGKGFLGFAKVNTIDLTMGVKTVAENIFWAYPLVATPSRTKTYLYPSGTLLNETFHYFDFVTYGTQYDPNKRYWQRVLSTTETNSFAGRTATSSYTYDSNGNVTQSSLDNNGVETTSTSTSYGIYAQPTSVTATRTRAGQPAYSVTTNFGYDGFGQLTSKTDFAGLSQSVQTTYQYNNKGNVTSTTVSPSGLTPRTASAVYDGRGQFSTSSTNALGQTATATYDTRWGQPLTQTGIDGLVTSYEYDVWGRMKKTTLPQGYSVDMTYNWNITGTKIYYTNLQHPGKPDMKTWHDLLGREVQTDIEGFQGQWVTQNKTYDEKGNVKTTTQPHKSSEAFQTFTTNYDNYNRPTIVSSNVGTFGQTNISYGYAGGNLTTTTIDPAGQSTAQVTDASGQVTQATDPGGTLTYTYNSQGNLLTVTKSGGGTLSSSQFDDYGRQTILTDPNAGTTAYAYDALGQLTSQTNANNQTSTLAYDFGGRNTSRQGPEGTTSYEYYGNGNGTATGQLKKVTSFAGNLEEYFYDGNGRLSSTKETVDGNIYNSSYTYNTYGDLASKTYPSNFGTNHSYDTNGYPTYIRNGNNTVTLYTNNGLSGSGVNTSYTLGNGKVSTVNHNYGIPTQYATPGVQNLTMNWQYTSGNLLQRKDWIKNKEENFGYDALNRLTSATVVGQTAQTIGYGDIGNIASKTDVGTYAYLPAHPNAVTSVTNPASVIPLLGQTIAYSPFAQPATVTENGYELNYTYGSDYNRIRSITRQNNNEINRRYYLGDYEKDITGGTTRHLHYIGSPAGLIAIVVRENGSDTYHYTYTDHLGSILTVTNSSGGIEAEQNFDAWGRRRNASTWVAMAPTATTGLPVWLYRGYTGHEQLDQFGLINMNGRLYDPALGRVLSADNFVVGSSSTQAYNRYTYAFNNPLSYNDPDGESPIIVAAAIGAAISGVAYTLGAIMSPGGLKANWSWKGFGSSLLQGAVGGAASFGIGVAFPLSGTGFEGALSNMLAHGVSGAGQAALFGGNPGRGFVSGFASAGFSIGAGAAGFGKIGQLAAGGVSGGLSSAINGGSFWSGLGQGLIVAGLNHIMHPRAPWDLNGDGILQKSEADRWWLQGEGRRLNVDNRNIDWSGLEIPNSTRGNFTIETMDAFMDLPYETAATYGGTTFDIIDRAGRVLQVKDQLYHYEMRGWNSAENIGRNIFTVIGQPKTFISFQGTPIPILLRGIDFMIHYKNPIFRLR